MKRFICLVVFLLACGIVAAADVEPNLGVCPADDGFGEVKGKPGPPAPACCDPALEPGANGNPLCFEGHICCDDGRWSCNNPDGSPSCKAGTVCVDCASRGESCLIGSDCCSGKCKGFRCR